MAELYPPESQRLNVLDHLEELRRRILVSLVVFAFFTALAFAFGQTIFEWTQKPVRDLPGRLIFISPSEGFLAYCNLSLLAGFLLAFPFLLFQALKFLLPAFPGSSRRRISFWLFLSFALFAGGIAFSYRVALPFAYGFLIRFGSQAASPQITLGNYVSFFILLLLSGGLIFQIPVFLGFFADIGLISSATLRARRPHALVAVLVLAAVITPTQDAFNMLLFALPMALLYECGILLARWFEKKGGTT